MPSRCSKVGRPRLNVGSMPIQPHEPPTPPTLRELEALASRELREFAWLAMEGVLRALGWERGGAIIASLIARLITLGEESANLQEAAEIAVVHGLMVHGVPPRNEREWEIARRIYEPEVIRLMETWAPFTGFLAPDDERR